jgi:hypothetical protein
MLGLFNSLQGQTEQIQRLTATSAVCRGNKSKTWAT